MKNQISINLNRSKTSFHNTKMRKKTQILILLIVSISIILSINLSSANTLLLYTDTDCTYGGDIAYNSGTYGFVSTTQCGGASNEYLGVNKQYPSGQIDRSYLCYDLTSLNSSWIINSVKLNYRVRFALSGDGLKVYEMNADSLDFIPTTQGQLASIYNGIGALSTYATRNYVSDDTNYVDTLSGGAVSDLINYKVSANQFCIGLKGTVESTANTQTGIYDDFSSYYPFLEISYNISSGVNDTTAPVTTPYATAYPSLSSPYIFNSWVGDGTATGLRWSLTCQDFGGGVCSNTKYCTSTSSCTPTTTYSYGSHGDFLVDDTLYATRYLCFYSTDNNTNVESTQCKIMKIDREKPVTTPYATANNQVVNLADGYASSTINVILSCSDGASGCDYTNYCIDETNTCDPTYGAGATTYTIPVNISGMGTHYIRYQSVDNVVNIEDIKSQRFDIRLDIPSDLPSFFEQIFNGILVVSSYLFLPILIISILVLIGLFVWLFFTFLKKITNKL